MKAIHEHDVVVLRGNAAHGLQAGDVGTVVHCYPDGKAFEVEFVTFTGHTAAVVTVPADQLRRVADNEIAHVRTVGAA